jgi:hypothetical protein
MGLLIFAAASALAFADVAPGTLVRTGDPTADSLSPLYSALSPVTRHPRRAT